MQSADPVDGVCVEIGSIYDEELHEIIKYSDLVQFMEDNEWLGADKDSIMEIVQKFRTNKSEHLEAESKKEDNDLKL